MLPLIAIVALMGAPVARPRSALPVETFPPGCAVASITIAAADGRSPIPVPIVASTASPPPDLPAPWQVTATGYEPLTYSEADLRAARPLRLRALGRVRARLSGTLPAPPDGLEWISFHPPAGNVERRDVTISKGSMEVELPAGLYHAALIGNKVASRICAAILARPGETTDLGTIRLDKTVTAEFRVVDAKSRAPVSDAVVHWDPPKGLHSEISKRLFATLWSTSTNPGGLARFPALAPVALRWIVEARGYVTSRTPIVDPTTQRVDRFPDVTLSPGSRLVVSAAFRAGSAPTPLYVELGQPADDNELHFRVVKQKTLGKDPAIFEGLSPGTKRIFVRSPRKDLLKYQDVTVSGELTHAAIALTPIRVQGTVTRKDVGQEGYEVRMADEHDATALLAKTETDVEGRFSLETYQRGRMLLQAVSIRPDSKSRNAVGRTIEIEEGVDDYTLDFELPTASLRLRVYDSKSGQPVPGAEVRALVDFSDGGGQLLSRATDSDGDFVLEDTPEGEATAHVSAKGYRSADVKAPVFDGSPEMPVPLDQAPAMSGIVVDPMGGPVPGALLEGGFPEGMPSAAFFEQRADDQGRFSFDSPPDPSTPVFAIAPGFALATAFLRPGDDNVIRLAFPGQPATIVLESGPPLVNFKIVAVISGGGRVPSGATYELAAANGLSQRDLLATQPNGASPLTSFLGPGTYDLFVDLSGGRLQWLGTLTLPSARRQVLTYRAP